MKFGRRLMSHLSGEKKALQGTKEQPSGTHKEAIERTEMGSVGGGSLGDNRSKLKREVQNG